MLDEIRQQIITLGYEVVRLYGEGQYHQAIPIAQYSLHLARQHLGEHDSELAVILNNLGGLYEAIGKYAQAEHSYQQAQQIYQLEPEKNALHLASSLNDLAFLYNSMGDYPAANRFYHEALDTWPNNIAGVEFAIAQTKNNLALLYQAMGNYQAAEPLLKETLAIRRAATRDDDHPAVAASLNNMAELYRLEGRYSEAEPLYWKALKIQHNVLEPGHYDIAATLNNIAALYRATHRYIDALPLYREALRIWRATLGRHPVVATSLHNLAVLHRTMGVYDKAEPLYLEAIDIRRQMLGEHHPDVAASLQALAGVYIATDRSHEALPLMQEAASIADHMIGQIFSISSESRRMAYVLGLQANIAAFLSLVCRYLSWDSVAVARALDLVLRRKAIAAEALALQRDAVLGGHYPNLLPQLNQLTSLRRQIAQKILSGPGPEGSDAYKRLIAEWDAEREQLETVLAQQIPELNLTQRLRIIDANVIVATLPKDTALVEFIRFDVIDFRAVPASGETFWKPAHYLAFVLCAGKPDDVRMIDLGEAEPIDQLISQFRAAITGKPEGRLPTAVALKPAADARDPESQRTSIIEATRALVDVEERSTSVPVIEIGLLLRGKLWDPLMIALTKCTQIFLAPDGDLNRLPFEVLPIDSTRYIIDDYRLSYLTVGRDILRFSRATIPTGSSALIIADPDFWLGAKSHPLPSGLFRRLVGTQVEASKLAALLHVTPLMAGAALKGSLRKRIAVDHSPRVLHLATHGFFLPDKADNSEIIASDINTTEQILSNLGRLARGRLGSPLLRSGLALAGANTWLQSSELPSEAENGILFAEDITGLDLLNTDLVVLSACDTGLGDIHAGEGVFGLRRAFVLAGAKTLVMSLWKVPDQQTQELMVDFYERILKGESRGEALRQAQLAMKTRYSDIYIWGAFICQGDPAPMAQIEPT